MSFLSSFRKLFRFGGEDDAKSKKKELFKNIKRDVDPKNLWDILSEIGDGAFGKVYKAERKEKPIFAALKHVEIKSEEDIEDFSVEIDILAECKHKNVVSLYEAFFYDSKLWMFIEYCGGGALDSIMVELEKPLQEKQIRYVCHEMCEGLEFLHDHKVIHRDLKAGNVLLTSEGHVKLADFGVSALNTRTSQRRDSFIGTPYWMAPEVIMCETLKDSPYNYRADIWSLGVTMIEFAQIEPPNHDMHPMRVLIKIQKSDPPTLNAPSRWSKSFNEFIKICLSKDPEQRPTAGELLQHRFIKDYTDKSDILNLVLESKAEVEEVVQDLTEEEDIQEMKRQMSDDSSIDLDEVSTSGGETDQDKAPSPEKDVVLKEKKEPIVPEPVPEKVEPTLEPVPEKVEPTPEPLPEKVATPEPSPKQSPKTSPKVSPESSPQKTPEKSPSPDRSPEISPQKEQDPDKSSDEGLGPSSDEKSDNDQNVSPHKPADDIKYDIDEIVDELIDEVIKSTEAQPSVAEVVFDTIQDVITQEGDDDQNETSVYDVTDIEMELDETEQKPEEPDNKSEEPDNKSEISDMSKGTEDSEKESICNDKNSISSVTRIEIGQPGDKPKTEIITKPQPEMEVQEIKVRIESDDETSIKSERKGKNISVITINGQQPPPTGNSILVNGHIAGVKDTSGNEIMINSISNQKNDPNVQQTDLDVEENNEDQKSDSESVNTEDSIDKVETSKPIFNKAQTRQHIRNRSENKSQYRTLTKTRTYVKDGVVVTSTTQKVVQAGEENRIRVDYDNRKQDLRELKMLQKQENKQYQDLVYKSQCTRETQERKFDFDMQNLKKNYDQDMDTLTKQQKQQVEKAETTQQIEMKGAGKRIKMEQEKELKGFKEQQKIEMKLLKQELDLMSKDNKKEAMRKRRDEKEIELSEKERQFMENQQERMVKHMKSIADQHRSKVALLESQFLQQKQQLLRAREAAIWELEKQQLHEKHQLAKSQLKDMFFLKRHQMLTRHQKEVDQMKRSNLAKEEEMQSRHVQEKRRLPRILKNEAKTRAQMFKQSLRLSVVGSPEDDRSKMKQFEENEKKRIKSEQQRQELKHKKQWEDLVFRNETSLRELEQIQGEKRKMLMEQETQKIKELDEQYSNELREWKQQLVPRKQRLEEEFQKQREEQDIFYGTVVITGNENAFSGSRSSVAGSLQSREDSKSRFALAWKGWVTR